MGKARKPREPADVRRDRVQREAKQERERVDKKLFKDLNDQLTERENEQEQK
jgi:hypothetical protein